MAAFLSEADAIKELERKYPSVEAFALHIFTLPQAEREALLGDNLASWEKKAGMLGLSTKATQMILLGSKRFQRAMKELSISNRWNFSAQDAANQQFVKDTKDDTEKPEARVKVAQYLNREAGITSEEKEQKGGLVVNVTFGGQTLSDLMNTLADSASQGVQDAKTITLDPRGQAVQPHVPNRSGSAIPQGVRLLAETGAQRLDSTDALLPEAVPRTRVGSADLGAARTASGVVTENDERRDSDEGERPWRPGRLV